MVRLHSLLHCDVSHAFPRVHAEELRKITCSSDMNKGLCFLLIGEVAFANGDRSADRCLDNPSVMADNGMSEP